MRDYPVKRTVKKNLQDDGLVKIMKSHFKDVHQEGDEVIASYGAMKRISAKYDGKKLWVETETDPSAPDELVLDTVKVYNLFLKEVTGYTARERKKLANKAAKESA